MCGIIAYTGIRNAPPILLDGLTALEYRGYDSAGLYVSGAGVRKAVGRVAELAKTLDTSFNGTAGIAHTRWATHGIPTEENAHPHTDPAHKVWLVHNGIIENYKELRSDLEKTGNVFVSKTDTEVLAHLVAQYLTHAPDLAHALTDALRRVRGTYGVAVMTVDDPETIVVARLGSPIVLGIGKEEHLVASDASPLIRHTKDFVYLADGELAILKPNCYEVRTLDHTVCPKLPETIEWDVETVEKQGFPHFMLKEIMEVPDVLINSARGRVFADTGNVALGGLADHVERLRELTRLIIVGCGSAYYAGLVGKLLIEEYANIPVEVEVASEFRYRKLIRDGEAAVLAISQSGETADTLASIREAKHNGYLTLGIVNMVGSTIARETEAGVYNHAGPEIGVASTKAFVSQLEVLAEVALYLGRMRGLSPSLARELCKEIRARPERVRAVLARKSEVEEVAHMFSSYRDFLYIGRKYNYGTAYEGALKLKEVSYLHAEGYGAGEMKHGPIAMIDERFPTVAIMPRDSVYEKMRSNVEEIRARKGPVLAITTEGCTEVESLADAVLYVPHCHEALTPVVVTVALQLFAYYMGVARGYDVDRPRNLAKSVTVE